VSGPFRFAVAADAPSATEWIGVARRAEELGFSTLFVADHYNLPAGNPMYPHQQLAPLTAMAVAATATTTLRVGARVLCMDYHVPVALAKEAATLDVLSNGRLEFGIGAGWHEAEYESMGLVFDTGARRLAKLVEVVAMVKAHFAGETIDVDGEFVQLHGYEPAPLPVQRPRPPIMIGGGRPRMLRFAGREADIVSLANDIRDAVEPMAAAEERLEWVRDGAGDRLDTMDVESMLVHFEVTDDTDAGFERIAPGFPNASPHELRNHPLVLIGSFDEVVERLEERRERLAVNYVTVPHAFLETFAPVVERLSGK
jgi:probable F420-dependent oxidoreductase